MRRIRSDIGLLWPGLGLAGSLAASAAATGLLRHRPIPWWWQIDLGSHGVQWHLFWAGVIALCVAWLGLGRRLAGGTPVRPQVVVAVAALWALPLALGPALFSLDLYSYLAQGTLLHHGLNPYRVAPAALAAIHHTGVLGAVSVNWRHTTAPYGPLFLAAAGLMSALAGGHVALGVTLVRLLELPGLVLLAVFVPRLARRLGADPARAVWLALAGPLTLLYLVAGGHNDALMAGLVVAGVTLALERRPLLGIAVCALAAMVKLPGAAGIVLIAASWLRAEPARWRWILAAGTAVSVAVVGLSGLVAGVGLSWLSGGLFTTPATAHLALTPATAVVVSVWELIHGVHRGPHTGVEWAAASWESAATTASTALVALLALWQTWRVRFPTLARALGLVLLAAALGGPALWPWYLTWSVVLLAVDPVLQRSRWLAVVGVASAFAVMAGGQVAIALPDAPRVLALYAVALGVAATARLRILRRAPSQLPSIRSRPVQPHAPRREHASVPSPEAAS